MVGSRIWEGCVRYHVHVSCVHLHLMHFYVFYMRLQILQTALKNTWRQCILQNFENLTSPKEVEIFSKRRMNIKLVFYTDIRLGGIGAFTFVLSILYAMPRQFLTFLIIIPHPQLSIQLKSILILSFCHYILYLRECYNYS